MFVMTLMTIDNNAMFLALVSYYPLRRRVYSWIIEISRRIDRIRGMFNDEQQALRQRLEQLRIEHRDLDDVIARLGESPYVDQLQLRRLKKRKLVLKDMMAKIESELIPDLNA